MNLKTIFAAGATILLTGTLYAQTQIGADINGEAFDDHSGYSISLSADGARVAISAIQNDGNGDQSGHVRVYQWSGVAWTPLGADIDGEASRDFSGESVSLSADGNRLAIGTPQNDGNGDQSGDVRVYQWSGAAWQQLGADINGEVSEDHSGFSISLSADGNRLAIGAAHNDGNGVSSGHVRVYQWSEAAWQQLGADIDGEAPADNSGTSVSLSADGNRLAIGATLNDGNGNRSGHVRVYQWSGAAWQQFGADIDGENSGDSSGNSVLLSADGTRLAIGASNSGAFLIGTGYQSGHVRVYQWSGTSWTQLGTDINGEASGDHSAYSISLSTDGNRLAIGAPHNDGNGDESGHVRLYQWSGSAWTQFSVDIDGKSANDQSGHSVSLSADGSWLAIGAPLNNGNGNNSGHVRVFDLSDWLNQMAFNGLFYDPEIPGHGFDFNMHATGLTIYYYGHTVDGERLWLVSSTHPDSVEFDEPFVVSLYEVTDGTYGNPMLPETLWGTLTITMINCDAGVAVLDGLDGTINMEFVRLVGLAGIDCRLDALSR